jgi:hypothetical protein
VSICGFKKGQHVSIQLKEMLVKNVNTSTGVLVLEELESSNAQFIRTTLTLPADSVESVTFSPVLLVKAGDILLPAPYVVPWYAGAYSVDRRDELVIGPVSGYAASILERYGCKDALSVNDFFAEFPDAKIIARKDDYDADAAPY